MDQYEEIAKLHEFPCKNEDLGCQVKIPFDDIRYHNDICQYRQYVCPILGSSRCEWLGSKADFLKHCEEAHPDSIKDNPVTLVHDITKFSEHSFLLRAFQVLFLLHTKLCVTSGQIYHAIRYLGRSDEVTNFEFTLIERNEEVIIKRGNVTNQECISLQEDTSLILDINSLLRMLGGFDNTSFTIILKQLGNSLEKCVQCKDLVSQFDFYDKGGWWCGRCAPTKQACPNSSHGCKFYDFTDKCEGHRLYHCEQADRCQICRQSIPQGSLIKHYNSSHLDKTHKPDGMWTWRTKWTGEHSDDRFLVPCVAGTAICRYRIHRHKFKFDVFLPVLSVELRKFKCSVRVVQVATGDVRNFTPDISYNTMQDWLIEIGTTDFPLWSSEFDVQVNVIKVKP